MQIVVDQSSVGSGKTYNALRNAIQIGGQWIFAVERIEFISELSALAKALKSELKKGTKIIAISSDGPSDKKRGDSVRVQVEALPEQYQNSNVIVFITHNAMLACNFEAFGDWHIVCDELPPTTHIEKMQTELDLPFFEKFFELQHITGAWALIRPTSDGLSLNGSDFMRCDSHKRLRKLHEIATGFAREESSQAPLCSITDFADMEGTNVTWVWWSQFCFESLSPFRSVTILASRFYKSLQYQVAKTWEKDIEWVDAQPLPKRAFKSRQVEVIYFSDKRTAAISFFETPIGQKQLSQIAHEIKNKVDLKTLIWSTNESSKEVLEKVLPKAKYLTPRQAGSSRLMSNNSAAMIYAAKPSAEVKMVLAAVGVSEAEWVRTVEHETIYQFVSRTSVRDPDFQDDVQIFVYDHAQAHTISDLFSQQSHCTVKKTFSDLGLEFPAKSVGRPRKALTPQQAKERDDQRRAKKTESQRKLRAKKAAGE